MEPAPERERKTTGAEFLRMHWEVLGATLGQIPPRDLYQIRVSQYHSVPSH